MASTTFVDRTTPIQAAWLNDVNNITYNNYVNVKNYGAVGDGVTDDTVAISLANAAAVALPYGATIFLPRGKYLVTSLPTLSANVNWQGVGKLASQLVYSGTGNGLAFLNASTNIYTTLRISLKDFAVVATNGSNTGGGLVLESCAYINVNNVYFEKFKYAHILDGCSHFKCDYTELAQQTRAGIWIVNGAERRAGQSQGFTNNIWYGTEVQINLNKTSGIYAVQDDGGVNHDFCGINFNSGDIGARFAGVKGLRYHNNAHESYIQSPLVFDKTSREGAVYVGPCYGVDVRANSFSNISAYNIAITAFGGGVIESNTFANMTVAAFFIGSNVADLRIAKNSKLVTGTSRNALPFFDSSYVQGNGNIDIADQAANTYVASSHAGGLQSVTPATMDLIRLGDTLYVENEDGTNGEFVLVTSVAASSFGATFVTSKAANWVIRGQGARYTEGSWTPTLFGTTAAGSNTYTIQQGTWKRDARTGTVDILFTINTTALSGMTGNIEIAGLPFPCANVTNKNYSGYLSYYSGFTLPANFTQLTLIMTPNTQRLALRRSGSSVTGAAVAVSELAAPSLIIGHMRYYTH
jgi:hypothetical protein